MKAKPVAKQGRKATGLMKTAGLPLNRAIRLFWFKAYGVGIPFKDQWHVSAVSHKTN